MLPAFAELGRGTPLVHRLGLATRGNTHLTTDDVLHALDRGVNFLNWCGHRDGIWSAVRQLPAARRQQVVIAFQFSARTAVEARRELDETLRELRTDYLDLLTFYYVEHESEWEIIAGRDGALPVLREAQARGTVRLIGLTTHQRPLAAARARNRDLDVLMVRYNAAHRGAETEVFPLTDAAGIPVIAFTGLRWGALLEPSSDDPPPGAPDCYRFVLSHPSVAVALMAPDNRAELEADLRLLDDWRGLSPAELAALRAHGDRVHRFAGSFP